jgi:MFS family permease
MSSAASLLGELSAGLDVSIRDAGLLITFGAIVLCIGSPLTAWLTSRIERHMLLTATLAVLALANAVSAFAPDYETLLVIPRGGAGGLRGSAGGGVVNISKTSGLARNRRQDFRRMLFCSQWESRADEVIRLGATLHGLASTGENESEVT